MKLEHYVIVFFITTITIFLVANYKVQTLEVLDNRTEEYNRNIDQAADDAMRDMIELTDSFSKEINLEECQQGFFNSLFASFGVVDSPTGQNELKLYIPVLLVTDVDGFYVMHHCKNEAESISVMQWSHKMPYCFSSIMKDPNDPSAVFKYTIDYRMNDEISLALTYKGVTKFYEGKYKYLSTLYTDSMLDSFMDAAARPGQVFSAEKFDEIRISAMTYQIAKKVNYYVNKHNDIAGSYGISYEFSLPESSTDSFARTIDSVSMMAIFQGYPFGVGTDDVYSRFSVSGSRLFKTGRYVVQAGEGGVKYYHRSNCPKGTDKSTTFSTKRECAEHGAYPCSSCSP